MASSIAKHNKPFSDREFTKVCPENKSFENISLSLIIVHHVKDMNSDLPAQLNGVTRSHTSQ
jgi:hypothetical protein